MARELLLIALASLALGAGGCSRSESSGKPSPSVADHRAESASAAPVPAATPPLAGNDFYRVDAAEPPVCSAGQTCEAKLRLTALGAYHVNDNGYPFKFVAEGAPGVAVEKDGAFAQKSEKVGELTVKFRAEAAGTAQVAGVFKLSVCSESDCQIEEPKIAFAVPVR